MSKVKVTNRGQRSKIGLIKHVWAVKSSCIEEFQNNFAQLLTMNRGCDTCENQVHSSKVKVTNRGQRSKL